MVCEAKALAKDPGKDDKEVKKRHSLTKTVDEGPVCDMAIFSCFFSLLFFFFLFCVDSFFCSYRYSFGVFYYIAAQDHARNCFMTFMCIVMCLDLANNVWL